MNVSTHGSMALRCCFGRLFASLSTRLACQRRAQQPRLTTPRLLPRPSRWNNGIGPEGATSLTGPLATLTKLQWLELRYGTLAACGRVALGGREAGRSGSADGFCAREGGNTLRFATPIPSALQRADRLFPHSPAPAPYDSRRPSPPQAQHPLPRQSVGPGGVARAAGRPVVPEPRRRRASQGEKALF
jgi:hypothetical protein